MPKSTLSEALRYVNEFQLPLTTTNGKGKGRRQEWQNKPLAAAQLERELRANPDKNIAIILNQCDLIDVEYDSPEGKETFKELFGEDLETPTWEATRGCHHLLFAPCSTIPEQLPTKIDYNGLEFHLGHNGKACSSVLPPSEGRKWIKDLGEVEFMELPRKIINALLDARKKSKCKKVKGELLVPIPEGKRNDSLYKQAVKLHAANMPAMVIEKTLTAMNDELCVPPLDEAV